MGLKGKSSSRIYEEFINSQESKAAISRLLLDIGYSDEVVYWIMNRIFPWFWIDNKETILTMLRNTGAANEEPYIGPLIKDWFHDSWKNKKYNFRERWYKWPPKIHREIGLGRGRNLNHEY